MLAEGEAKDRQGPAVVRRHLEFLFVGKGYRFCEEIILSLRRSNNEVMGTAGTSFDFDTVRKAERMVRDMMRS